MTRYSMLLMRRIKIEGISRLVVNVVVGVRRAGQDFNNIVGIVSVVEITMLYTIITVVYNVGRHIGNVVVDFGQVGIGEFVIIVKRLRFAECDMIWIECIFRLDIILELVTMLGGGGGRGRIGRSRRVLNECTAFV